MSSYPFDFLRKVIMKYFILFFLGLSMSFATTIELSAFSAGATKVNWDTTPSGTAISHTTPITNQYQSWGILVSSLESGSPWACSAASDAFTDPNLLAPPTPYSGTIVITFVNPSTGLRSSSFTSLRAGTKIDPTCGGYTVKLEAFDYDGNSLGYDVGSQGTFIGIESSARISYVVISGGNYTIDDFIFEPLGAGTQNIVPEVPELSSLWTILIGIAFLSSKCFSRFRRNK